MISLCVILYDPGPRLFNILIGCYLGLRYTNVIFGCVDDKLNKEE